MSSANLTASANYAIRKRKNESDTILLTPAYFSRHYLRASDSGGERQEELRLSKMSEQPYKKQREMSTCKKENDSNTVLLTPAYFSRHYLRVSISNGEKREEFLLPKMDEPCEKCENVRYIKEHTIVQTTCYCSEIVPENYLTFTPSADDIYMKMSASRGDLPWS